MKKSNKKNRALIVLVVLLIALAIGYAAFQTVLTVNGTATGTITWDVHFTSDTKLYEVTDQGAKGNAITSNTRGSVSLGTASTTGQNQAQSATVTVDLKYPGDAVLLETVIKNDSTQDAKLTGFQVTNNTTGLIITQPNNATITPGTVGSNTGDVLTAGTGICTAQFLIKWDPTAAAIQTASGAQSFTIEFTYSQDTTEKSMTTLTHSDS